MVAVGVENGDQGGAEVEISPSTLRVRPLVMTDPASTGALAEIEAAIVAELEGRIRNTIEAASLRLTNPSGKRLVRRAAQ